MIKIIIHKSLFKFLEIIFINDVNYYKPITKKELKTFFKNNEYYNLESFCIENNLINIEYDKIITTDLGKQFFTILKRMRKL